MNTLKIQDIDTIIKSIQEDEYLITLCNQKNSITNHKYNILSSAPIVICQIMNCFIPFFLSKTQSLYSYSQFAKKANPKLLDSSNAKEKHYIENFYTIIEQLKEEYKNANYIPPFITHITESMVPRKQKKEKKSFYRNYEYNFFSANSYSYIIRNYDCLPFFHKDRMLTPKNCQKYFNFFIETEKYTLIDSIISQYYIDKYFSIHLFAKTLDVFSRKPKTPTYTIPDDEHTLYLDYFLFLCTLLQNNSGMNSKDKLFSTFYNMFFESEDIPASCYSYKNIFNNSYRECFKQCVSELIFYNEFLFPYVKKLYVNNFEKLLNTGFPVDSSELYKQFVHLIQSNTTKDLHNKNLSVPINFLKDLSKELPWIDKKIFNYTLTKFYNYSPLFSDNTFINSKPSYSELLSHIQPCVDILFLDIDRNHIKNAGFPI